MWICSKAIPPPLKLYGILRALNPAPHAAHLRFDPRRLSGGGSAGEPGATLPGAAGTGFARTQTE